MTSKNKVQPRFLALIVFFAASQPALTQESGRIEVKTADIVRLEGPPVLDGKLDDGVWARATVIKDLHQIQPNEFERPSERTEFYLYYDDEALYVGARVWDSRPQEITARVLRQGGGIRFEDRVAVVLDPFYDKRNGYMFEVNPNGVRLDGLWENTTDFAPEWDGIWAADAHYLEDGWTAEMAIPFKTLSFDPNNDVWGVNLWRFLAREQEFIGWKSQNRTFNPSAGGVVRGFRDLSQGAGLDIVPSVSLRRRRDFASASSNFEIEPSLDLFYKVTPALNASLTVNTDFSATEVDARQVNVTRFGLFFPERRDFFLKDGDIFEFGKIGAMNQTVFQPDTDRQNGKPFFSRRIGLSEAGQPVDLDFGAKLSGRIGEWNVGALAIRQAEFESVDATNMIVARAARNVLAESTLGTIMTYGDPTSNADNALIGVDFAYRNTRLGPGLALESEVWFQKTETDGLSGDDAAFGFNLVMPNSNKWRGGIGFKEIQQNFDPRLGFAARTGIRNFYTAVGYTHRPEDSAIRTIRSGINFRRFDRIDGDVDTQVIFLTLASIENQQGDSLGLSVFRSTQGLIEPFEIFPGIIIPTDRYDYGGWGVNFGTGNQRKFRVQLDVRSGGFFAGDQLRTDGQFTWRPSKHYSVTARYARQDIDLPEGSFITRLITLQNEIAFSSKWAWVTLAQFDNISNNLGIHSRLHWIPTEGREMFVVLNHNFVDEDNDFRSTNSEFVVKLNYTFRF
ncbi:MAG: carbohydrate binding family 9 domain-containing protein [Gammaproteobacteria bacterium]|nr:carbohydrate binding family 9 domain-containing protein [Gammaproteobacteria bacterium]